jgi:hypothetical protein
VESCTGAGTLPTGFAWDEYHTGLVAGFRPPDENLVIGEAGTYFALSGPIESLEALRNPLPAHIAELGSEFLRTGKGAAPGEIQPLYVTPVQHRTIDTQGKP